PARAGGSKRLFGALKGQIRISDDFDELGPEWDEYIK
ncbi:MAG: type II toxin-antitoxin system prevent-host-death family antitoxin, partial [Mesorhizobium sp.]